MTPNGKKMFQNFLFKVVGMKGNYTLYDREKISIEYIQVCLESRFSSQVVEGSKFETKHFWKASRGISSM